MADKPEDRALSPEYHLTLGAYLTRLRAAGLVISDEQEAQLFQLLAWMVSNGSQPRRIGELASALTPVLAGTPQQQALCHETALAVFGNGNEHTPREHPFGGMGTQRKPLLSRILSHSPPAWIFAALFAVVLAVSAVGYYFGTKPMTTPSGKGGNTATSLEYGNLQSLDWIYEIRIKELEPPAQSWRNRTLRWYYAEYDLTKWIAALGPWLTYALIMIALIWTMLAHLQREKVRHNISDLPYTFRGDRPYFGDRALTGDLQPLRSVPRTHVPEFDGEASVDATVRAGGVPSAVFRNRVVPVEFVALVDRRAPRDHFAAYGDVFFESLLSAGIRAERFYFNTSPTVLSNARTGQSERAKVILNRLPGSVILAFLTEDEIFDPMTGRARSWITDIAEYGSVFLFVPESQAGQPQMQAVTPPGVSVLPSSSAGLRRLVDLLTDNQTKPDLASVLHPLDTLFARLSERRGRWMQSAPIPKEDTEALIDDIGQAAGQEGLRLVAATSVYPELRWPMTLRLRDRLSDASQRSAQLDSDLLRIVQLPWFRSGWMPQWLRARLIEELPGTLSDRIRMVIFEAVGFGGEKTRDGHSLGLLRENGERDLAERTRSDRMMLQYLFAGQRVPKHIFTVPRELARKISRRPFRNTALAGVAGAFLAMFSSFSSLASLPINNCDLWGASLFAPDNMGLGWDATRMERNGFVEQAIEACRQAVKANPNNRRFQYQYVRALAARRQLSDEEKKTITSELKTLADQGYAPALNELGYHYMEDSPLQVPRDRLKALDYFRRAYEAGAVEALKNMATVYRYLGEEDPVYWEERKKVLKQHYDEGGILLWEYAYSYRDGSSGFEKNEDKYIELAIEGARRGEGKSALEVGYLYAVGELGCSHAVSCSPDYRTASRYYRLAIELESDPIAALNLANNYRSGRGTDIDLNSAFYWAVFAARLGDAEAAELLVELVAEANDQTLKEWGVERAVIRSRLEALADRAEDGSYRAQYLLGRYLESIGEQDEALRYYKMSAEGNYSPATEALKRLE
ncbi:tetratricopeptide repeat protein [Rhizobium leguminosarum]|uniref:tetratricopeptide repeat protein n=1 Tax=Rhizobium leguminosarum TaxID=384 RepID=UPI003F97F77B